MFLSLAISTLALVAAPPPGIVNVQGVIEVAGSPFTGTGMFKFALVNNSGDTTFWSHDDTSVAGSEPTSSIAIAVADGRYSVALGNTPTPNPSIPIPSSIFANNADVRLRIWFDDGTNGFQLLSPDQRILSVGYALHAAHAETVSTGGITTNEIADQTITESDVAAGGIHSLDSADGTPTDALFVDNNGNVGVNTTSPLEPLHIFAGPSGNPTDSFVDVLIEDDQAAILQINAPDDRAGAVRFGREGNAGHGLIRYTNIEDLEFATGGNNLRMTIESDGNVGINTDSPSSLLDVNGDLEARQLLMPESIAPNWGVVSINGQHVLHSHGTENIFVGGSGNFDLTGTGNTAVGYRAFETNQDGSGNTALGLFTLSGNTSGNGNVALGVQALFANQSGNSNIAAGDQALFSNSSGSRNIAIGAASMLFNTVGTDNTATGFSTLSSNVDGAQNTAVGAVALAGNTTGDRNTATGYRALAANTEGSESTANGTRALESNTTGIHNTSAGWESLRFNTTGSNNSAVGSAALWANTTGSRNSALGSSALASNSTGTDNIAIGGEAQFFNTTGQKNTAIGANALRNNTTGENNIAIGFSAGELLTTGDDNISIGASGNAGESNAIRIGTKGTQTISVLAGKLGIDLERNAVPAHPIVVGSGTGNGNGAHVTAGGTWTNGSSKDWKTNFREVDKAAILQKLAELPLSKWEYEGVPQGDHIGPTAEDFHAAFGLGHSQQHITTVDADGVALVAIQALNDRLEKKDAEIASLREELELLKRTVTKITSAVDADGNNL